MSDNQIVRASIHPAIGIARVGDSPEDYFIGPRVPEDRAGDNPRDPEGRLKRQAAQFRIYGYNAAGEVVRELTHDRDTSIEWTVHVANTKAAWFDFELAMDIPEAQPVARRNPSITGSAREGLAICPPPEQVSGVDQSGVNHQLLGQFMGTEVYLGELRTDDAGRLLFLGGRGKSASYDNRPLYTFANNETWHDDVCDGPVSATVVIQGRTLPVESAWVVCAPPNYAPEFKSVVTLYDLLTETMIAAGFARAPKVPSFTHDILPLLTRNSRLQWLNAGFLNQYATGGLQDLTDPSLLQRLASESPTDNEIRRQVFNAFRNPDYEASQRLQMPWIYGDGMEVPASNERQWVAIVPHMYENLRKWADGEFLRDYDPHRSACGPHSTDIDDVAVKDQPEMLDKAALSYCLADAFHPGCELTWPIRHSSLYGGRFRILARRNEQPEADYGSQLTPQQVYSGGWASATAIYGPGTTGGPLWAQGPGDLSRWMAVPWQADTASCRDGYDKSYDEYVPTFWPARVPNQVLSRANYEKVIDAKLPMDQRVQAFRTRDEWLRSLPGDHYLQQIRAMVDGFSDLGVVVREPDLQDSAALGLPPNLPMYVEDLPAAHTFASTSAEVQQSKRTLQASEKAETLRRRKPHTN